MSNRKGAEKNTSLMLSICIPTFNRALFLEQSLKSITDQFKQKEICSHIEIVISNNNSQDNTEKIVKKFQRKYKNIRYFKNKKNIGAKNTMKVATQAKGQYIWFFSDDDLHQANSLATVLSAIERYHPDLITVNLDLWSKDTKQLLDPNLLRLKKNILINSKKALFSHLEDKFFLPIDWYLTTYSNTILKRSIFISDKYLFSEYPKIAGLFPQKLFIYYKEDDYKIYISKKSLVRFRADNRSFGPRDQVEFLAYWYSSLPIHYDNICRINKNNISLKFLFLVKIKNLTRYMRLLFLKVFKYDISAVLIKLFYK